MKKLCIFLLFASVLSIGSSAQNKAFDVDVQYNKKNKNVIFRMTNKTKTEMLFFALTRPFEGSQFYLQLYNEKDESIFLLDFPFIKDGENYKKSFLIQPGEIIVCSYNIHNLAKSVFEKKLNVKRIQLKGWVKYGMKGAKRFERIDFNKKFDY